MKKLSVIVLFTMVISCGRFHERQNDTLGHLSDLDEEINREELDFISLRSHLNAIEATLLKLKSKQRISDGINVKVTYRWNQDSSIVMVTSHKEYDFGFKRERALYANDSLLFTYMFDVRKEDDNSNFTFIETVDYLTSNKVIKALGKIKVNQQSLSDTITFQNQKFNNHTQKIQNNFYFLLDYWQNVFDYN